MQREIELYLTPKQALEKHNFLNFIIQNCDIKKERIKDYEILKRAVDARKRPVKIYFKFLLYIDEIPAKEKNPILYHKVTAKKKVFIIGSGPAGLFAALEFIKAGIKPIIFERGKPISERKIDIAQLNSLHQLNTDSNYCFGEGGAGHFVKMVHNGIEYGDMQIICEAYQVMKDLLGLNADEIHQVFKEYNEGDLDSYLIEITRDIMGFRDENGEALVEKILDTAGQKGTGKWTGVAALDLGIPLTLIGESVFARCLSAQKDIRVKASKVISGPDALFTGDKKQMISDLKDALFGAKIISYAQGYNLMMEAANEYKWNLNYGGIALMWRGGCIIRSTFLGDIKKAFDVNPGLENLLLDPHFKEIVEKAQAGWRRVCATALINGVPVPALTSALCYFDGLRSERLPANLLQAQRDYFGAHTYERIDKPRGEFFHTNWTGRGGDTASTTYVV